MPDFDDRTEDLTLAKRMKSDADERAERLYRDPMDDGPRRYSYRPCAGCDSVGESCIAIRCPAVATSKDLEKEAIKRELEDIRRRRYLERS